MAGVVIVKNTAFDSEWCNEFLVWENAGQMSVDVRSTAYSEDYSEIFINKHVAEASSEKASERAWCADFLLGVPIEIIESISTVYQEYSQV